MKKLITILSVCIFLFLGCDGDSGSERAAEPRQGETYLLKRFVITYWMPEWGYGNGKHKQYVIVEVDLDTFNRYRPGDVIPTEDLICPELEPYVPLGTETIYLHDPADVIEGG